MLQDGSQPQTGGGRSLYSPADIKAALLSNDPVLSQWLSIFKGVTAVIVGGLGC